jgi:hypothetical protein
MLFSGGGGGGSCCTAHDVPFQSAASPEISCRLSGRRIGQRRHSRCCWGRIPTPLPFAPACQGCSTSSRQAHPQCDPRARARKPRSRARGNTARAEHKRSVEYDARRTSPQLASLPTPRNASRISTPRLPIPTHNVHQQPNRRQAAPSSTPELGRGRRGHWDPGPPRRLGHAQARDPNLRATQRKFITRIVALIARPRSIRSLTSNCGARMIPFVVRSPAGWLVDW